MKLTIEEEGLISSFDHASRKAAIADIWKHMAGCADRDLYRNLCRVLEKLKRMSDREFSRIDFTIFGGD